MIPRKLTVDDLCKVSGYSRHQLRRLLEALPAYNGETVGPRVAREFLARDLTVISVLFVLEQSFHINRNIFAQLIEQLSSTLSGPKPANRLALLHLSFSPISIRYATADTSVAEGVLISLGPIFEKVDTYLSSDLPAAQQMLNLGFTNVVPKKQLGG